jgi:GMP synthase (glutamine-hydrolysing)
MASTVDCLRNETMTMKILLLQARHYSDTARLDERLSFAKRAGLPEEAIVPYDLLSGSPVLAEVQKYDALMIGGSGEYYVSKENLPGFLPLLELLGEVTVIGHPTFASCFGFQLLVKALGGEIVYDADNMEVGTYRLTLTESGHADDLFGYLPATFMAQLGHKDRAGRLPNGVESLAFSDRSPCQAIRVPGKPIWATQFHPELTAEENLSRFRRYMEGYAHMMSQEELGETLSRFEPGPESEELIPRFLELI